jgi:hypothetical protein
MARLRLQQAEYMRSHILLKYSVTGNPKAIDMMTSTK